MLRWMGHKWKIHDRWLPTISNELNQTLYHSGHNVVYVQMEYNSNQDCWKFGKFSEEFLESIEFYKRLFTSSILIRTMFKLRSIVWRWFKIEKNFPSDFDTMLDKCSITVKLEQTRQCQYRTICHVHRISI